eukprot:g2006.t1
MGKGTRATRRARPVPICKTRTPVESAPFEATTKSREDGDYENLVETLFQQIQDCVEERRSYYRVAVYAVFVFAYMAILYAQGSLFQSYDVVSSLRDAIVPGQTLTSTFKSNDALLDYIGRKLVLPVWVDPVCGDGKCQWPWEFPSFGRFGCKADCGSETNTKRILLQIRANFGGELTLSPRTMMANVRWNVCLNDTGRVRRGQDDICWFAEDQVFEEIVDSRFETMELIEGEWYVRVIGDFTRKVQGRLFDITNATQPIEIHPSVNALCNSF